MGNVTQLSLEESDALLKFVETYMRTEKTRKVSKRTREHYERTARQYFDHPEEALQTKSKATYYARKAALIFVAAARMIAASKIGDYVNTLKAARVLQRFFTYTDSSTALAAGSVCPIDAAPKVGKRKSLRGLPLNWREQLVAAAPSPTCREWMLLLAVAGVRPAEVAAGIGVQPIEGGVELKINGVKTDRGHGQPKRVISAVGPLALMLAVGGARTTPETTANAVSVAAGKLGRKVFGVRRSNLVSAYSFRHQFASDLKASGLNGLSISAILGHSVDDTKKQYGTSKQARGIQMTRLVSATRTVKILKKSTFAPTVSASGVSGPRH